MRKLAFRICFIGVTSLIGSLNLVLAQSEWKAKVKLNNSITLKGFLKIPPEGEALYLRQADSTNILIERHDIKEIKLVNIRHQQPGKASMNYNNDNSFATKTGFYHQIFVGASFGEEEQNGSLGILNGFRFSKLFALDLGVNYDRYKNVSSLPIYLQPRIYLKNKKVSVYYFTGLGFSQAWANDSQSNPFEKIDVRGGLMGQAGIGYQVNFLKSAINFTLGYKLQRVVTNYEYFSSWSGHLELNPPIKFMDIEEKRWVRRVYFTFGYTL